MAFTALARVVEQLADAVRPLSASEYVSPGPRGVSGSIGRHVRHCLDHVTALEAALVSGVVDYEARERGTRVEHDRLAAVSALDAAQLRLARVAGHSIHAPLLVRAQVDELGRCILVESTVGRELAFVISHTIHHAAFVNMLLAQAGRRAAGRFGFAHSTPIDRTSPICVPSA